MVLWNNPGFEGKALSEKGPAVIAYGALCVWWDDKALVGAKPSGLPCCPVCGGVLFEVEEDDWFRDAATYEQNGHPGYLDFLTWLRGKCFRTKGEAENVYAAAK